MGDSIAQVWCEKFPGRSADTGVSLCNAYAARHVAFFVHPSAASAPQNTCCFHRFGATSGLPAQVVGRYVVTELSIWAASGVCVRRVLALQLNSYLVVSRTMGDLNIDPKRLQSLLWGTNPQQGTLTFRKPPLLKEAFLLCEDDMLNPLGPSSLAAASCLKP